MTVVNRLLVLFLLVSLATARAQTPPCPDVEDWEDLLMATRSESERRDLLREAAASDEPAARAFVDRRLRVTFPDQTFWAAYEAAANHRFVALPTVLLDHEAWFSRADDRRRLWRIALDAEPWREETLDLLIEEIDRHRHDPRAELLLPLLEGQAEKTTARRRGLIADLLLSIYEDPDCQAIAARAHALGRSLPGASARDFDIAALFRLDADLALPAARALAEAGLDGLDLVLADSFLAEPRRFLAAGLGRLITAADGAALRLGLVERIEEVDDEVLRLLRRLLGDLEAPELDLLAAQILAIPGRHDRLIPLALDRLRAGHLRLSDGRLEALLAGHDDPAIVLALLDALADRGAEGRDRLRAWLRVEDPGLFLDRLECVARAAPLGPTTGRIVLGLYAGRGRDWRLRGPLLGALAALDVPEFTDLAAAALEHERWQLRLAAIEALIRAADRSALARLAPLTGDPRLRLARAAAEGLRQLVGEDLGTNPKAWMQRVARLPIDWRPPLLLAAPVRPRPDEDRYVGRFYGLDLGSNRIVFVCDSSGSMQGGKFAGLNRELDGAIGGLDGQGAFNILFFADQVTGLWHGIRAADRRNRARARTWADRQVARGGTNLWAGLERALEDDEADTLVVLTDGQPTVGRLIDPEVILASFRQRNRHLRLQVHAVELGLLDTPLMRRLAAENGGRHQLVP